MDTMEFAHSLGIKILLSEFSPIPGTPDGDLCAKLVDLNEPLWHNKMVFTHHIIKEDIVNMLKNKCKSLNNKLGLD